MKSNLSLVFILLTSLCIGFNSSCKKEESQVIEVSNNDTASIYGLWKSDSVYLIHNDARLRIESSITADFLKDSIVIVIDNGNSKIKEYRGLYHIERLNRLYKIVYSRADSTTYLSGSMEVNLFNKGKEDIGILRIDVRDQANSGWLNAYMKRAN